MLTDPPPVLTEAALKRYATDRVTGEHSLMAQEVLRIRADLAELRQAVPYVQHKPGCHAVEPQTECEWYCTACGQRTLYDIRQRENGDLCMECGRKVQTTKRIVSVVCNCGHSKLPKRVTGGGI